MREVKAAKEILKELKNISKEKKEKITRVDLKIGELNEPESVRMWLEKLSGEEFAFTEFRITRVPISVSCECGYSGEVGTIANYPTADKVLHVACPKCGEHEFKISSGREKEIVNLEWEE